MLKNYTCRRNKKTQAAFVEEDALSSEHSGDDSETSNKKHEETLRLKHVAAEAEVRKQEADALKKRKRAEKAQERKQEK